MRKILFVTGNQQKLDTAKDLCAPYGIQIVQKKLDITEVQAEDGEAIARDKAQKAYDLLRQPLIVNDDTWIVPGLNGFPGPYMKSMNEWFSAEDWLRITAHLEDRRIILRQYVIYQDAHGQQLFAADIEGEILREARGAASNQNDCIISFSGDGRSNAEVRAAGESVIGHKENVWPKVAAWLQQERPAPTKKPDIHRLLELQELLHEFQAIERVTHVPPTLRRENDTEHSYNMAITAWFLAQHFPHLDINQVIRIALVHDLVEVHAGDTYIYADPATLATKAKREADALEQLSKDWADFPALIEEITAYEQRASEEAKFIYALDKIMPIMVIFLGKGHTWQHEGITPEQLHEAKKHKVALSPEINAYYDQLRELLLEHPHYFTGKPPTKH